MFQIPKTGSWNKRTYVLYYGVGGLLLWTELQRVSQET